MDTKYQEIKEENLDPREEDLNEGEEENTPSESTVSPCVATTEIFHKIFCSIEEVIQKRITDWNIGNGYYLFDFGENTVCHFRVPGAKKWLFGIWAIPREDGSIRVDLFGEHEWHIDKFKPTATKISDSVIISNREAFDDLSWELVSSINAIISISRYPIAAMIVYYWNGIDPVMRWLWGEWWFYTVVVKWYSFLDNVVNKWLVHACKKWINFRWKRKGIHANVVDNWVGDLRISPRWDLQVYYPVVEDKENDPYEYIEHKIDKFKSLFFRDSVFVGHYDADIEKYMNQN